MASDFLLNILFNGLHIIELFEGHEKCVELFFITKGFFYFVDEIYAVEKLTHDVGEHRDADQDDETPNEALDVADGVEITQTDGRKSCESEVSRDQDLSLVRLVHDVPGVFVIDEGVLLSGYGLSEVWVMVLDVHTHEGEHVPVASNVVWENHNLNHKSRSFDKVGRIYLFRNINSIIVYLILKIFIF